MPKTRELTQIEREQTLYQIDGYYSVPYGVNTPETNFDAAKAELIQHLKRNIENVELATFDMFSRHRRVKHGNKI